jgi:hypothetical protein
MAGIAVVPNETTEEKIAFGVVYGDTTVLPFEPGLPS